MSFFSFFVSGAIGYLVGSIPFGLVLTKMAGVGDIRKIGSGNIGATNVLRTGRKDLAAATLLCDIGKAAIIAYVCSLIYGYEAGLMAGTAAVFGHNFPIWLNFKGGKGVASTLGLMIAMTPAVGLMTILTWLFMAVTFRYSSLSALTALALSPIYALIFGGYEPALFYAALAILSVVRHKDNIKRLIQGKESKINLKKKAK